MLIKGGQDYEKKSNSESFISRYIVGAGIMSTEEVDLLFLMLY